MHSDLYIAVFSFKEFHQYVICGEIFGYHSCDYRGIVSLSITDHSNRDISPGICLHIIESEDNEFFAREIIRRLDTIYTELITNDREYRLIILYISLEESKQIAHSEK